MLTKYLPTQNDFGLNMFFEMIRIVKADPNAFNVLNHGDAWCNNFLFRYGEDNTIEEITLVSIFVTFSKLMSPLFLEELTILKLCFKFSQ